MFGLEYIINQVFNGAANSLNVAASVPGGDSVNGWTRVVEKYTPTHYSANAVHNAIKTGAGVVHGVSINTKGATGNNVKVYDGLTTGGTLIATIDTTVQLGLVELDAAFTTGLTVDMETGTAADITVLWA